MQTRQFPRHATNRPLTATVFWDDLPIRKVHGRCLVLSEGGLGATLADQLYVGEVVRLEMPPIPALYASVRDTRGTEHGFEFVYVREGQRKAVHELCSAVAASERRQP